MTPNIPAELKCMVMENLHGDKKALAACSVLSQAWQGPARAVLFRSITLCAGRIPTKSHHLFSRLQVPDYEAFAATLPHALLNAVHDLEMSGLELPRWGSLDYMGEFDRRREVNEEETEWDEDDQPSEEDILWTTLPLDVILRIVDALPNLKSLSLSDFMFNSAEVHDGALVRLKKIALRSFAVRGRDDILRLFDVLGADEITLDVFRPIAVGAGQPGPAYAPRGYALASSFEFSGDHRSLRVLQAVQLKPPPLTSLAVHIQALDELREVDLLLKSAAPTLTRLFLDIRPAFVVGNEHVVLFTDKLSAITALDLASLKKLTHFELGVQLGYPGWSFDTTLQLIITVLRSMASSVPISSLTLHFHFPLLLLDSIVTQSWLVLGSSQALVSLKSHGLRRVELAVTHSLDGYHRAISLSEQEAINSTFLRGLTSVKDILYVSF